MQRAPGPALNPALLPPGTQVGSWRVVDWAGRGVHGAVYRAVRVGQEPAEPVALKLALVPRNPRFAHEAELLSRLNHPSIPRLRDRGDWQHPSGVLHPFLVMDWIEGVPLYDWARLHAPTSQQVIPLLAQLARALQVLHAQDAVHRDVKGDNVLVRSTDGRAVLTDLGAGWYPDAATLTPRNVFPGTPAYRAPETWLFSLQFRYEPSARYTAGPADDLFALGVTACRLLTGEYPELSEPIKDKVGTWHLEAGVLPPQRLRAPRVDPRLRTLILRMLSERPEERGTAAALAEALEQAVESSAPRSARTSLPREPLPPSIASEARGAQESPAPRSPAEPARARVHARHGWPWLSTAAVGLMLTVWAWWAAPSQSVEQRSVVQKEAARAGHEDAGTVGLGEVASTASTVDSPAHSSPDSLAEDTLPAPLPGQARPDAKGRCPRKRQVALNGGCWVVLDRERCEALNLSGHMVKDTCYVPVIPPGRPPTTSPGVPRESPP